MNSCKKNSINSCVEKYSATGDFFGCPIVENFQFIDFTNNVKVVDKTVDVVNSAGETVSGTQATSTVTETDSNGVITAKKQTFVQVSDGSGGNEQLVTQETTTATPDPFTGNFAVETITKVRTTPVDASGTATGSTTVSTTIEDEPDVDEDDLDLPPTTTFTPVDPELDIPVVIPELDIPVVIRPDDGGGDATTNTVAPPICGDKTGNAKKTCLKNHIDLVLDPDDKYYRYHNGNPRYGAGPVSGVDGKIAHFQAMITAFNAAKAANKEGEKYCAGMADNKPKKLCLEEKKIQPFTNTHEGFGGNTNSSGLCTSDMLLYGLILVGLYLLYKKKL